MSYIRINDENIIAWKEFLGNAVRLLNMYRNILDTYVLDFFVEDFWSCMNQSWQKVFTDATPQFLANIIISLPCRSDHVLPLSLLAFRASTFTFSLPRSPVRSPKVFQDFLQEGITDTGALDENKIRSDDLKSDFPMKTCSRLLYSSKVDAILNTHSESPKQIGINIPSKCDSLESADDDVEVKTSREALTTSVNAEHTSTTCRLEKQDRRLAEDSFDVQIRNLSSKLTLWGDAASELSAAAGQHAHLHHAFRRHVKPKKQHEAARLATVAAMISHATDTVLVDVGSGQGHLSRLLAYGLGTRVLCLDAQEQFTLGARKFDAQLEACMHRKGLSRTAGFHTVPPKALPHPPRHVTLTLHPDMDTSHLLQVLQETYSSPTQCHAEKTTETAGQDLKQVGTSELGLGRITCAQTVTSQQNQRETETDKEINSKLCRGKICMSVEAKNESQDETVLKKFGLLGLHTCGDLAPTMIRLFVRSHECRALISVGCCYMKMNTLGDGDSIHGYPLSVAVSSLPGHYFTYEALESSCHAIDSYAARLKCGADNLKVHCYRAVLEDILMCRYPQHKHAGLRSVSHAHTLPFPRYAQAAIARLPDVTFTDEELDNAHVKEMLDRWMQVVVFYSLRLMLAPVVESVVLLDRLLYLYEQGYEGLLVPLFDPSLSPRNFVLLTVKNLE